MIRFHRLVQAGLLSLLLGLTAAAQTPGPPAGLRATQEQSPDVGTPPPPRAAAPMKALVPAWPEALCRPMSATAGLDCKPTGAQTCPAEVLYQPMANGPVKACPASCVTQSFAAGRCECVFTAEACRDRPGGRP